MRNRTRLAALLSAAAFALPAGAAEIRVLSAAAMQTVFKEAAGDFERISGHRLVFAYATMGAITQRALGGEAADVVISSTPSIERLVKDGRLDGESTATIARVGVGLVVPNGTPRPSIASVEDLRKALLDAKVVVYANPAGGGAAGIHVAKVLEKLGVADRVKGKTRFGAGGDVTEVTLEQGAGALGLTQISEIVHKPGAQYVGPLPAALQNYTGVSVGAVRDRASAPGVRAFLDFLSGPGAAAALRERGMEPVESSSPRVRLRLDPQRGRTWLLTDLGVYLDDAARGGRVAIALPEWQWVGEPFACMPDLAVGPGGEAIITSNVLPKIWKIDPRTLLVTVHQLVLDADTGRDVGFSAIQYSQKHGAYLAVSELQRSFWRIDLGLTRASKIAAAALPPAQRSALVREAFCSRARDFS